MKNRKKGGSVELKFTVEQRNLGIIANISLLQVKGLVLYVVEVLEVSELTYHCRVCFQA